jgi:antibiotic biosynthesis monooxygenase (ABM) superfamily enzyme
VSSVERTTGNASPAPEGSVTIVTQTCVRPQSAEAFARWQEETSAVVAKFPGFIKQTVMPPSPPAQVDWVILQRFASNEAAVAWLNSEQRLKRGRHSADAGRPRRHPHRQ